MKMRNSRIFKIIAFVLVQAFLLLDVSWAGADIMRSNTNSTLAPSVNINKTDVQNVFSAKEGEDILSGIGMLGDGEETIDEIADGQERDANSSSGVSITPQGTSSGLQQADASGSNNPNLLVPPPDINNMVQQLIPVQFSFVPWWKRKDLEEYFRKNYGIEFISEGISRKELRQFYRAFETAYTADEEFRNNIFQSEHWQVEILGDSLYFDENTGKFIGDRAVWPSYDPNKEISKISLYKPFFYKYKFNWFNITRDVAYQQTELRWVVKQVIGTKLLHLDNKDVLVLSQFNFSDPNAKAKLQEYGVEAELPTMLFLKETILADRDPARGWLGHRDVMVVRPELIRLSIFNAAFSLSSLESDSLNPEQKLNLYRALNRVARERKATRVTATLFNEVLGITRIKLNERKKDDLIRQLNRALDQVRDEEEYWAVMQKTWPDGEKGSVFIIQIPALKKLHRLAQGCRQYLTDPIRKWKITEADSPMTLLELVFKRAEMVHEGGVAGHRQNIPVKDESNPVLPIPIGAAARKTTEWLFNLAAGNFRKAYGFFIPRGRIAAHIGIKETLKNLGYNPYTEGPAPFPGIMKEVHATAGVFQESGILGVAAGLWFFYVFEADDIDMLTLDRQIDHVFKTRYTFLNAKTRNLVKQSIEKIDQDYRKDNKLEQKYLGFEREDESMDDGYSLRNLDKWLTLIAISALFLASCSGKGASGIEFNAALLFVVTATVTANIIMARRTTRSRTIRLLKSAVKKKDRGYSELGSFYNEAGYADKGIIIDTLVNEALSNAKEVNKEDLEPIFTFALGENVEGILGRVYDAVVSGLRLSPASGAMTTNDAEKVIRAVEKEVKKLKLGVDAERIASEIPLYILDFSQQRKLRDKDAFLQAVEAGTKKEINFAVQALRHKAAMAIRRLTEIEYHGSQRLITIIEKHLKDRNAAVREDIGAALRNLGVNVPLPIQMMKKPQAETKVQVVKREPESPQIPSSESSNGQITGPQESIKAMLETRTVRHKVDSDDLLIEKKEVSLPGQVVMCETSI
ncbi:MAG: hypothetical protein ABII75_05210 [Candidatus Omnitrophota bacterium]